MKQETENIVGHALDLGINFFDTANGYSDRDRVRNIWVGRSKSTCAKRSRWSSPPRSTLIRAGFLPRAIHREIEGTLERLGTDYLDLYIIHRFDYETPIEETMEALNDLVVSGKVRAIGASAMYGYQFYNMQMVARDHGWAPFVGHGESLQSAVSGG